MKKIVIGVLASAVFWLASPAMAVPIVSGQTNVQVTAPLADLGITPALLGGDLVSADPLTLGFGVTGGDLDFTTLAGTIEHVGASISLTGDLGTVDTSDDVTVILSDFLINTTTAILSADVNGGGMVDIFSLDFTGLDAAAITDLANPQISLTFLDAASALLESTFQLATGTLTGAQFGLAATAPVPAVVSEPTIFSLLAAGMLGLVLYRSRSRT
uniref:hypothetical protein n=1 Tax=Ningiella ruwaisensis TaxID=2364274 RepID=UPI0010A09D10|nr:hypothetical protein [Ningiella ruwaisensis]